MSTLDERMNKMSPARRKKVEARTAELIAEEMTLRELRRARKLTQVRVAKACASVRMACRVWRRRTDLMLSTLRKSVEAMGGSLTLVVEFPDRAPVILSGIAEDALPLPPRSSPRSARIKTRTAEAASARKVG